MTDHVHDILKLRDTDLDGKVQHLKDFNAWKNDHLINYGGNRIGQDFSADKQAKTILVSASDFVGPHLFCMPSYNMYHLQENGIVTGTNIKVARSRQADGFRPYIKKIEDIKVTRKQNKLFLQEFALAEKRISTINALHAFAETAQELFGNIPFSKIIDLDLKSDEAAENIAFPLLDVLQPVQNDPQQQIENYSKLEQFCTDNLVTYRMNSIPAKADQYDISRENLTMKCDSTADILSMQHFYFGYDPVTRTHDPKQGWYHHFYKMNEVADQLERVSIKARRTGPWDGPVFYLNNISKHIVTNEHEIKTIQQEMNIAKEMLPLKIQKDNDWQNRDSMTLQMK